jgi:hypothetical protein
MRSWRGGPCASRCCAGAGRAARLGVALESGRRSASGTAASASRVPSLRSSETWLALPSTGVQQSKRGAEGSWAGGQQGCAITTRACVQKCPGRGAKGLAASAKTTRRAKTRCTLALMSRALPAGNLICRPPRKAAHGLKTGLRVAELLSAANRPQLPDTRRDTST